MTKTPVRVRFAPSPTGPLHMGGVRTALYNYLFAKKSGGAFILRIEDTDQNRYVEGAEEYINEALEWCGIFPDEGVRQGGPFAPYRQSERKHLYQKYAEQLIQSGNAYYAFDTAEDLEEMRLKFEKDRKTFTYGPYIRERLNNSLNMNEEECKRTIAEEPYVIRFKMPEKEDLFMDDMIRGEIVVNSSTLDDKVLFKSDGMPTYHLANVVDDHLMEITHVIRGEEWLPSLPLHMLLYEAFQWEEPSFAHLPLLLKPGGKGKLSKRDGDKMGFPVFPLYWPKGDTAKGYREEGYYPEAFVNMLALLGWNPGTSQELFSMDELIESFSFDRVGKAGARFDPEKAKWFNQKYFEQRTDRELAAEFGVFLTTKGIEKKVDDLLPVVQMVRERCAFVPDLWRETDFLFRRPEEYDPKVVKKRWKEQSPRQMNALAQILEETEPFTAEETETRVKEWIQQEELGMGAVMNAFRLLIVGELRGPHMFDIISLLGKKETLERLLDGTERLKGN